MKQIAPDYKIVFIGIILIFICGFLMQYCVAAYSTDADIKIIEANPVGSKNVTLHGWTNPENNTYWFEYGRLSNMAAYPFRSDNITSGGNFTQFIEGLPLLTSQTYYGRLCNATYCSASEVSWTMDPATPIAATTHAKAYNTLIAGGKMNLTQLPFSMAAPYTDLMGNHIVWGLIFAFLFIGYWFMTESVELPVLLGAISSGSILYAGSLSMGIPPEFVNIAQALMIVSVIGLIYTLLRRR